MKNKKQWIWIAIILIIALGGYVIAFIQFKNNVSLEQALLNADKDKIGLIDAELESIRETKAITLEELQKSEENIKKLIQATKDSDTTSLNLNDALKIINNLE